MLKVTVKKNFKKTMEQRMARLGVSHTELAYRLGISNSYLCDVLAFRRDSPRMNFLMEKVVDTLDEIEKSQKE